MACETITAWCDPDIEVQLDNGAVLEGAQEIVVTVKQGAVLIKKTGEDLTVDPEEGTITFTLEQEDTGRLNGSAPAEVKTNILTAWGKRLPTTVGVLGVESNSYEEVMGR